MASSPPPKIWETEMKGVFASLIAMAAMMLSTPIANASNIQFSVGGQTQTIDSFLYNSANTIAVGSIPSATTVGATFNFFYQSSLSSPQFQGSNVNYTALTNGTTFITAVIGGNETVSSVTTTPVGEGLRGIPPLQT